MYGREEFLSRLTDLDRQLELLDSSIQQKIETEVSREENQQLKSYLMMDAKIQLIEGRMKDIQKFTELSSKIRPHSFTGLGLDLHYKTT